MDNLRIMGDELWIMNVRFSVTDSRFPYNLFNQSTNKPIN